MKPILLLGFFLLGLLANEYHSYTFDQYLLDHQKSYSDPSEHLFRKSLFETRLQQIIEHNSNPSFTWQMGVNQFTDMTESEQKTYRSLNKKLLYNSIFTRGITPPPAAPTNPHFHKTLPDTVDWRTAGVVTNVKNQGSCGSCWTFGAVESIESLFAQQTKGLTVLSEQNVLDCTPNPNHCGGTGGCGGGTVELAWDMVIKNGIATEKDYPYISGNSGRDYSCKKNIPPFTNITGYVNLPVNQQDPVMDALANIGPLAINVDAASWMGYRSGVFDGCNQKNPDIDHVVQLVGYGTDSKSGPYWLVRNSWGTGYGEKGYIRLRRETGTPRCGTDITPSDGTGCDDGPPTVTVCGTCGILFDVLYPVNKQ